MSLFLLTCICCSGYRMCCSSSLYQCTVFLALHSERICHLLAENLYSVQLREKVSIYTCAYFDNFTQPWLEFCWKKVAIQSKVSNLGGTGHNLPRLSYCNHYVLCNVLLSSSCLGNLGVIKSWEMWSFLPAQCRCPVWLFTLSFSGHSLSWNLILTAADLLLSCRLSFPQVSYL